LDEESLALVFGDGNAELGERGEHEQTPFSGWGVEVRNTSGSAHDFHAYVVCAS
jgi:hypothetical protein